MSLLLGFLAVVGGLAAAGAALWVAFGPVWALPAAGLLCVFGLFFDDGGAS